MPKNEKIQRNKWIFEAWMFFGEEYGMARLPYAGSRAVRYLHLGD